MLKRPFIEFLTKRKLRKRPQMTPRSFENARTVGIIINLEDSQSEDFDDFVRSIRGEGKITEVLKVGSTRELKTEGTEAVTKADISMVGNIKSEQLKSFLSKEFDFLLILDHQLDYLIQYIASLCKAAHKVGFNDFTSHGTNQLDLQIKPEKDREFEDLLKYTKMIKYD